MEIEKVKQDVVANIVNNNYDNAFNILNKFLKGTLLFNELVVIQVNYSYVNNLHITGKMSYNDFELSRNKITHSLMAFIDKIDSAIFSADKLHFLRDLGLNEVFENYQKKLNSIMDGKYINLIGKKNSFDSYINSIKVTNWRLCTTSFLDSEFWYRHGNDHKVIHENILLNKRIKNNSKEQKGLSRLFVIPDYFDSYIYNKVEYALSQEKLKNDQPLNKIREITDNLKELADEIEMKIIEKDRLPKFFDKNFGDPSDNVELALYDDFRIDVFRLDRDKRIEGVGIYTKNYPQFDTIHKIYIKYFNNSWNSHYTINVQDYIRQIDEEIEFQKEQKIDYETNWLLKYDHYIMSNNYILNSEKSRIVDFLNKYSNNGISKFKNYLDIGVCTARYPLVLKNEQLVDSIDTLDSDYDVELFMKNYRPEFNFLRVDIRFPGVESKLGKKYDLITCMLGTVCHFGLKVNNKKYNNSSGFYRALENMICLLNERGLLIISVWKKWSVLDSDFKLYNNRDIQILKNNTPSKEYLLDAVFSISTKLSLIDHLGDEYFNIFVFRKG